MQAVRTMAAFALTAVDALPRPSHPRLRHKVRGRAQRSTGTVRHRAATADRCRPILRGTTRPEGYPRLSRGLRGCVGRLMDDPRLHREVRDAVRWQRLAGTHAGGGHRTG